MTASATAGGPAPPGIDRTALLLGVATYGIWGAFPAFFQLLRPAGAVEILAHRVVWTALVMTGALLVLRRLGELRRLSRRDWALLVCTSAMILTNWLLFTMAVNYGHVVDSALGYFINPLVSVALGVLVFRERLNWAQGIALVIAVAAVGLLAAATERAPWVALGIAFSFALYGALHKALPVDPAVSVAAETAIATPFAIAYLVALECCGQGNFANHGTQHIVLTVLSGLITAFTLMMFATAAQRLPLVTMGLLQYLMPSFQLLWGLLANHETMSAIRWAGLALIWLALAVFSADALVRARSLVAGVRIEQIR